MLDMLHKATIRATCVATKLRDKLQEKLLSVTAPYGLRIDGNSCIILSREGTHFNQRHLWQIILTHTFTWTTKEAMH